MTVRQRAVVALGRIKDPQALPALVEVFLEGKRESYDASKAIRKFGKKALPEVAKAFESTNNQQLMMLLAEIKNAFPGNYPEMFNMSGAPVSMPEVMGLLGNSQMHRLNEVLSRLLPGASKLVEIPGIPSEGMDKALEDIAWKFGVMFADARDVSQERVKRLTELLKSDSSLRRAAAALTLPWYTKEESLHALEQVSQDPDETVRRAATWAFHALQKALLYRKQAGL